MRDKFLTESMEECWHKWKDYQDLHPEIDVDIDKNECLRCHEVYYISKEPKNCDFSTWQGFGKLWEWAGEQEWFPYFINEEFFGCYGGVSFNFARNFINPDRFADALYEFLNRRNK